MYINTSDFWDYGTTFLVNKDKKSLNEILTALTISKLKVTHNMFVLLSLIFYRSYFAASAKGQDLQFIVGFEPPCERGCRTFRLTVPYLKRKRKSLCVSYSKPTKEISTELIRWFNNILLSAWPFVIDNYIIFLLALCYYNLYATNDDVENIINYKIDEIQKYF